jgi:hypothetical protein
MPKYYDNPILIDGSQNSKKVEWLMTQDKNSIWGVKLMDPFNPI